jgi:SnoaL-like domain
LTLSYEEDRILRSLVGSEAVRNLSVRQAQAFAAGNGATWIGTFVVGGELELPGGEIVRGHVALGDWFANADRSGTAVSTGSVVTIDGVRGTQQSTVLRLAGRPEGGAIIQSLLSVVDDVVYERGRWYFSRRRVEPGVVPGR